MRGVIAAAVITLAIICGSIMYTNSMVKISEELLEINDAVGEKIAVDDYDGAAVEIERLGEYLRNKRVFLSATGNHLRLDEIEMNVTELAGYNQEHEKSSAIAHQNQLSVQIEHLPRDYMVTLENIL